MGLSRSVSEINGDFRWKMQIFRPHLLYATAEGVALELDIGIIIIIIIRGLSVT